MTNPEEAMREEVDVDVVAVEGEEILGEAAGGRLISPAAGITPPA